MVDLSVVIVNWNTRELLFRCLQSIQNHPPARLYEIWVVDNGSSDGSATVVREEFPWVNLIANAENLGFAAANNQAIRQAQGEYVVLLNSDTEVRPGALQSLLGFMAAHPRAGAAGARLLHPDGSLQPSCHPMLTPGREVWRLFFLDRVWRRATYAMHRWSPDTPRQVDVIKGACLLLRREALTKVGLLDEAYFMYTEEVDLCWRLAQAGWQRWWVPQAEVIHHEAQSTRQVAERMLLQLYHSKVYFYRKFGGERRAGLFKRFVQMAYSPRLAFATLVGLVSPSFASRARTYRRLLVELPGM
jgi:N-acetylglucosaminyl-diphospho-decaprenol L-rhamnosyltransferase